MILYIVICVVLQICFCKEKTTHNMAVATVTPKMNRNVYKKTAELIYLINKMHGHDDYENKHLKGIDMDYFNTRNQEMTLKLLKLMQKNYDASRTKKPEVRLHFISNPEVLEMFRNILKEDALQHSFEDNDRHSSKKFKEILRTLRRQAVFRIDDPTSEEKLIPEEQSYEAMHRSIEGNAELINKQNEEATGIKNSRKKETESNENMDTWDIITKKYNWDDKEKKDVGGNKGNKDTLDKWEQKEDNIGQKKKDINKLEYWGSNDEWNDKENKKKNLVKSEDWGKKNVKEDSNWEDTRKDKNNDNWGLEKTDTAETWDDLDKSKPKKVKNELNWNEPSHKRKGSEIKQKKQDKFDTKWDKKDKWDNWEKTTRQRKKTTKRRNEDSFKINEWDHHVPKGQKKHKRYEFERKIPAGAFGRTSIPFVGKKSIYEEN